MAQLEECLKQIKILQKEEKKIFEENKAYFEELKTDQQISFDLKQKYYLEIQGLESNDKSKIILQILQCYSIEKTGKLFDFFTQTIEPLESRCNQEQILMIEYTKARDYFVVRICQYILHELEENIQDVYKNQELLKIQKYLEKCKYQTHLDNALNMIYSNFKNDFEDSIDKKKFDLMELVKNYLKIIDYLFADANKQQILFLENFYLYLSEKFTQNIQFKFHNNIEMFLEVIQKVSDFLTRIGNRFQKTLPAVKKAEINVFQGCKNYLENYNDKVELLKVLDEKESFVADYFREYDKKSIKIWLVNLINLYLENLKIQQGSFKEYCTALYRFQEQEYKKFNRLFNNYFSKKQEELFEEFYQEILQIDMIQNKFNQDTRQMNKKQQIQFYKNYFQQIRYHTDHIINKMKDIKLKEIRYKDDLIKRGIEKYLAFYHSVLSKFLALDLKVDKKQIFTEYVSDLRIKLYNELLSIIPSNAQVI